MEQLFLILSLFSEDPFVVTDRPFVVTQRVTEVPVQKPTPPAVQVVTSTKPWLVMYTGKYCGPCQQWKRTEKSKVEAAGYKVIVTEDLPPGVSLIPTFKIMNGEGNQVSQHTGFTAASALIGLLKSASSEKVQGQSRWTQAELRSQLSKHGYTSTTTYTRATVAKGTSVYDHLMNEHQFSAEQVSGLKLWEAMSLHDACHPKVDKYGNDIEPPLITPFTEESHQPKSDK